jgi:hypothetical protein
MTGSKSGVMGKLNKRFVWGMCTGTYRVPTYMFLWDIAGLWRGPGSRRHPGQLGGRGHHDPGPLFCVRARQVHQGSIFLFLATAHLDTSMEEGFFSILVKFRSIILGDKATGLAPRYLLGYMCLRTVTNPRPLGHIIWTSCSLVRFSGVAFSVIEHLLPSSSVPMLQPSFLILVPFFCARPL